MLVAGCATLPPEERAAEQARQDRQGSGAECIWMRQMRNFRVIDQQNLIVHTTGRGESYHVSLFVPCHGLSHGHRILIETGTGRLCGGAGDVLIVGEPMAQHCRISQVRQLDAAGVAEMLAARGETRGSAPAAGATRTEVPEPADDVANAGDG